MHDIPWELEDSEDIEADGLTENLFDDLEVHFEKRKKKHNKERRNNPRKESHFLFVKKNNEKIENVISQKGRQQANFWKFQNRFPATIESKAKCSNACRAQQPLLNFQPPNSQHERELQAAFRASANQKHASGITFGSLLDLLSRDLTPEDYEMLLLLDTIVEKKTTSSGVLESMRESEVDEKIEGDCSICITSFELGERIKHLRCDHMFHVDCISEWLSKHSQTCPLCNCTVT